MERLTKRLEDGQAAYHECHGTCGTCDGANCYCIGPMVARLAAYEDTGLEPEEIKEHEAAYNECLTRTYGPFKQKISQWLQAEQDGRLVVLPCKVGDTVYFTLLGRIIEKPVFSIVSFSASARIYCAGTSEYFRPEDFGKTVFLTREEAEAALAGKGHNNHA